MSTDVFGSYGRYYDLLYRDKDYAEEADYVATTLRRSDRDVQSILEFGSGTGRHGRLLAERGFAVTGIERSAAMAGIANGGPVPRAGSVKWIEGDIRAARVGRLFDAVISLFHVISYQTTNADLRAVFSNAATHLRPDGRFLFDVWHGPAVLTDRPAVRVKRMEDGETKLWRLAEPSIDTTAGIVTVRYTMLAVEKATSNLTTFEEEHRMRYLFPAEIDLLAVDAGFAIERSEEFVTAQTPSDRTWGVAYLLRKS